MGQRSCCLSKLVAVGLLVLATGILSCGKAEVPAEGEDQEKAQAPGGAEGLAKGWTAQTREVMVATAQGEEQREITYYKNTIGMEFVLVSAGEFLMGSRDTAAEVVGKCGAHEAKTEWFSHERPQHRVRITKPFYMGVTEVTNAQYDQFVKESAYDGTREADDDYMGHHRDWNKYASTEQNYPVVCVSWNNAQAFCRWLSQKTGKTVRLPTEAQWEYACRAGTTTPFSTGETISTDQANYDGTYCYGNGNKGEYREKTLPVGSLPANPWGLYDMHGNVWEWCQDWYGEYDSSSVADPEGPRNGTSRVWRGGSQENEPQLCRSAYRITISPAYTYYTIGFRVVLASRE